MTDQRANLFAPKSSSLTTHEDLRKGTEVQKLVSDARKAGGFTAGWRISRQVDREVVESVGDTITTYFAARREEMAFRIQLMTDDAKKRAIADSLENSFAIEREIGRLSQEAIKDLVDTRLAAEKQAALDENRRTRDYDSMLAAGDITASRHSKLVAAAEKATDDIGQKIQALGERLVENLGERLEAALRTFKSGRP